MEKHNLYTITTVNDDDTHATLFARCMHVCACAILFMLRPNGTCFAGTFFFFVFACTTAAIQYISLLSHFY